MVYNPGMEHDSPRATFTHMITNRSEHMMACIDHQQFGYSLLLCGGVTFNGLYEWEVEVENYSQL